MKKYANVCQSGIAERLRNEAETQGITQEQLADMLGLSRQTVNAWFNDRRAIPFDHLLSICDIFGCDIDHLLGVMEEKTHVIEHISDYTGLSEKAIDTLVDWKSVVGTEASFRLDSDGSPVEETLNFEKSIALHVLNLLFNFDLRNLLILIRQYVNACHSKQGIIMSEGDGHYFAFDDCSKVTIVMQPDLKTEPVGVKISHDIYKTTLMKHIEKYINDFSMVFRTWHDEAHKKTQQI